MPIRRKQILEYEILSAQRIATSEMDVAKKLGISFNTYKKWAKQYGLFGILKKNPSRVKKSSNPNSGTRPIDRILKGEFPNFDHKRIKPKMIAAGIREDKCDNCGFEEKRIIDGKTPIIISFNDGNKKNHKLENINFLCYNCCFILGINLFGHKKTFNVETTTDQPPTSSLA